MWQDNFGTTIVDGRWRGDMGKRYCMNAEDVGEIEEYNTDAVDISTHVHHLSGFAFTFSPERVRPRTLRTEQHSAA